MTLRLNLVRSSPLHSRGTRLHGKVLYSVAAEHDNKACTQVQPRTTQHPLLGISVKVLSGISVRVLTDQPACHAMLCYAMLSHLQPYFALQ